VMERLSKNKYLTIESLNFTNERLNNKKGKCFSHILGKEFGTFGKSSSTFGSPQKHRNLLTS
jgi:hypothetical protein